MVWECRRGLHYDEGTAWMEEAAAGLEASDGAPDRMLLAEYRPVVTLGRSFRDGHLLVPPDALAREGVALRRAGRGGDATWHGPGQWTVYPVVRLRGGERDIHKFLRALEQGVMDWLAGHGVAGTRRAGLTGVWVGSAKLAAIGVSFRRWISGHGLAVNINCDLRAPGRWIVPCGIGADLGGITSLARATGLPCGMEAEAGPLARSLAAALGRTLSPPGVT